MPPGSLGKIKIACKGNRTLPVDQLVDFQKNLKELSRDNYQKLRKQILELGFSFPIFVWLHEGINYTIDGHNRCKALKEIRREGYEIPELPVCDIEASNRKEAKKKLLAAVSQYAQTTPEGLYEFMTDADLDHSLLFSDFKIPDLNMDDYGEEFGDEETPEEESQSCSSPGDIWQLGDHQLVCGINTIESDQIIRKWEKASKQKAMKLESADQSASPE